MTEIPLSTKQLPSAASDVRRAWLLAARPNTLPAAAAPVLVGAACAYQAGGFRFVPAVLALLGGLLIQVGTNYANDFFDFIKGADTEERVGPTRAVQAGLILPDEMFLGMVATFALAFVVGLGLVAYAGWPILLLGLASILSGVIYTGGPYPLAYNGLGEVFVLAFFGFAAVCGTAYVQMLTVPATCWWAGLAMGALSSAILVVNNLRDETGDAKANKGTLVVRYGRQFGLLEYNGLVFTAYVAPLGMIIAGAGPWVLLTWLTMPWAGLLIAQIGKRQGRELLNYLKYTALLLMVYSILLTIGLVV